MNLHALRIFSRVTECGSVTRAAAELHLTQPAVTAQIRKLETEIGLKVIQPNGRGIELTSAGQFLYQHAKRLFAWEEEIERQLHELREGKLGSLRLSVTHLPAQYLLPSWLASYKRAFPDVNVTMSSGNSRYVYDQLIHYQADVGIVAGGWEEAGIVRQVLCEDELWFVVPADHAYAGQAVTLEEMMKQPFLFREEGSSTREYLLTLCQSRELPPPPIGLQLHGMNAAIQAMLAGYGAMLVPQIAVQNLVAANQIARVYVKNITVKRNIFWCMRQDEQLSGVIQHFFGHFGANRI
ncbi:LysR family transcriptional regulator [Brevibacillus ginsengisoli]|uniref:LysR family transcriptional regulator n=1 Tax=Brevibacillus ginsengisoli TaxID=363854 RepID=UPI003CF38925